MDYLLFFSNAGAPAAGLTPSIITYKKVADGSDLANPPAVIELGGGFYKFSASPVENLAVAIDGGAGLADDDRYKALLITPHDADLDAAISSRASLGAGAIAWTYTLTAAATGLPIADADIWVSSDAAGKNILASGRTDQNGQVTFHLDVGTVYVWRQKSGWNFVNPDMEVVS
jgi:hypothetical protein